MCEGGHVWDFVGFGVFGADGCHAGVGGFTSFGEGVVAGVEVFSFLKSDAISGMSLGFPRARGVGGKSTFSLFCRRSFLLGSLP